MNLKQIDAFRMVMLTGSITGAAQNMNTSQPSVTRLIQDLERMVGFQLFERSRGSGLSPTAEANSFFAEVEKTLIGLDSLKRAAHDIRNFKGGQLKIACLPALAMGFMPRVIKSFVDCNPDVTIQLQTRSTSTVHQWVAAQQFDIGIARPGPDSPKIEMETFAVVNGVCVLPPGHRLAAKPEISPGDLAGEPFISLALEDKTRHLVDDAFRQHGVEPRAVVETQYAATICGLVLEGVGVSVVSPISAADFVNRGLVVRPFTVALPFDYMLVFAAGQPRTRLAKEFISMMKQELRRADKAVALVNGEAPQMLQDPSRCI